MQDNIFLCNNKIYILKNIIALLIFWIAGYILSSYIHCMKLTFTGVFIFVKPKVKKKIMAIVYLQRIVYVYFEYSYEAIENHE